MSFKQAIVVRTDLRMGKGKLVSQCCHACLASVKQAPEQVVKRWEAEGAKKVVLKVGSLKELEELHSKAKELGLPCCLVVDKGLTQVEPETVTCLAIGPAEEECIDALTKHLKLL